MTESVNPVSRRSFLRTGALGGGVAAAGGLAAPAVLAQSPHGDQDAVVLAGLGHLPGDGPAVCRPRARDVRRPAPDRPAAGRRGGRRVPGQDAVDDGVIDAAHTVPVYWYGKTQGGLALRHRPGVRRRRRPDARLDLPRRRPGVLPRADPGHPRAQRRRLLRACRCRPSRSAGSRTRSTAVADMQGLKYRTVGLAADLIQAIGLAVAQLPGGEIVPAMERGVIDAFEFNNPTSDLRFGAPGRGQELHARLLPPGLRVLRDHLQPATSSKTSSPTCRRSCKYGVEAATTANYGLAHGRTTPPTCRSCRRARRQRAAHAARDPGGAARGLGRADRRRSVADDFFKRVIDSQKAWGERVVYYSLMNAADYEARLRALLPGQARALSLTVRTVRAGAAGRVALVHEGSRPRGRMQRYIRFADTLSAWFGKAFAWLIMVMTFGIGYEVVVRYVLRRADALGVRRHLHHVRHAVHDGRRLHAVARRPRPRRLHLPAVAAADPGGGRTRALLPLLLPRRSWRWSSPAGSTRSRSWRLPRGQHQQPGRHPDLPVQDGHRRRRHPALPPGHRAGLPLHHLHAHRRMAAAAEDVEETEKILIEGARARGGAARPEAADADDPEGPAR